MSTPLLLGSAPEDSAKAHDGSVKVFCVSCGRLSLWRGTGSNRRAWKAVCTAGCALVFGSYFDTVYRLHGPEAAGAERDSSTCLTLLLVGVLTLVKFLVEIWGQETPTWVCPGGPVLFCAVYLLGFPSYIYTAAACSQHADLDQLLATRSPYRQAIGFVLFSLGSAYSLCYEVGRFRWKRKATNKGRLHTEGLARYCIHPNYLGDLITYTGWGIVAGTSCSLSLPTVMVWSFAFLVCPNSDAYLAEKYRHGVDDGGTATPSFSEYAARTATLIPGVRGPAANYALGCIGLALSVWCGRGCAMQCG
mmetsp:Transcript_110293/g.292934  ORF Transcript_110293/g.292934 Transcript_110293/m.292934 type:complete len:305 (-) Transcript_110293:27-941(-)